jgi:hypothetical protein
MELRYKLRMLGIKIDKPAILLIDNQSVIANTTLPSSTIKKKHNSIAYHRMREAVAAGIIKVGYIPSSTNLADILTKPIGPADYWRLLSEPLYGRDRAIEGELQGNAITESRSAKTPPRSELNSQSYGQVVFPEKPYRFRVTLYVESQDSPDHERNPNGIQTHERNTGSDTTNLFCTVCGETLGSTANRIEPKDRHDSHAIRGTRHGSTRISESTRYAANNNEFDSEIRSDPR